MPLTFAPLRSFSPRAGRRWREAPDEGRHPAGIAPHPALRATLSPQAGRGNYSGGGPLVVVAAALVVAGADVDVDGAVLVGAGGAGGRPCSIWYRFSIPFSCRLRIS